MGAVIRPVIQDRRLSEKYDRKAFVLFRLDFLFFVKHCLMCVKMNEYKRCYSFHTRDVMDDLPCRVAGGGGRSHRCL